MYSDIIRLCGLSQEQVKEKLAEFELSGLTFSLSEENLDCRIELFYNGADSVAYQTLKSLIYNSFSPNVYSSNDMPLNCFAVELMMRSKHMLGVAESLTGGEICSSLIDITGISSHFFEGIVCYNSESKIQRLGVSATTIKKEGAISRQTAYEMVKGVLANPAVTLGLATTGLAGPTADEGKEVGLVYIAVGSGDFITVFEHNFKGDRNEIRKKATNMALFYLIRFLQGNILLL